MKWRKKEPENIDQGSYLANRWPHLTGEADIDWCLWQLVQVLREIAQSSTQSKDNQVSKKEDSDNENK